MNRFNKILCILGILLIIVFVVVLYLDRIQFEASIDQIMVTQKLKDIEELQGAFFSVVIFRFVIFCVPGLIFLFSGLTMHYRENYTPGQKGQLKKVFWDPIFHRSEL